MHGFYSQLNYLPIVFFSSTHYRGNSYSQFESCSGEKYRLASLQGKSKDKSKAKVRPRTGHEGPEEE
jgi:hypothetical protein